MSSTAQQRQDGPRSSAISRSFSAFWRLLRKVHLLVWILVWTIIGILLGLYAKEFSQKYMGLLSSHIFLPMVKCIIVPLVFSTLVVGIAGHGDDLKRLGRMATKSIALFMLLTVVAIFIGLLFGNLVKPGEGINIKQMSTGVDPEEKVERHEMGLACKFYLLHDPP